MAHWRAYIKNEITEDDEGRSVGGDFVRVIDIEAKGSPEKEIDKQLEAGEVIDQIVTVVPENPNNSAAENERAVAMHYGEVFGG